MNRRDGRLASWPGQFGASPPLRLLPQTTSTQDAARRLASGLSSPLAVLAALQTAGRGRLGRTWIDRRGKGVAMTLLLPARDLDASLLSLACGIAVVEAVDALVGAASPRLGLKWPNDVVTVDARGLSKRKLAGVLVERADDRFLAGIGLNVHQELEDFPQGLEAVSLSLLGAPLSRPRLAGEIARRVVRWSKEPAHAIIEAWKRLDALTGANAAFLSDGREHRGLIERIEPLEFIELRDASGSLIKLAAATTQRLAT
jgi:BirA family biotin operon repressor/biotin-[acetyl-CoA-carboxylase] ligase